MSRQTRDLLEEFITNALLITPTLGYMAFESLKEQVAQDKNELEELLYFARNHGEGGNATGKLSNEGFWVLRGSFIYPEVASYCPQGVKRLREQYADSIDADGILQKDILFGSPSYASTFVCGKNSNGLTERKNEKGLSLKEMDLSQ